MSKKCFNDLLKEFYGMDQNNIPKDFLITIFNNKDYEVHPSILNRYEKLSPEKKKEVNDQLWELANVKERRSDILEKMSKGYEQFFDWEEVATPPCS